MPAPEKVEPCAYCGSTEHATTTVGHRYIFPLPEKVLPANESGCGCPLEVRYREALERVHKRLGDLRVQAMKEGATQTAMLTFDLRERVAQALALKGD